MPTSPNDAPEVPLDRAHDAASRVRWVVSSRPFALGVAAALYVASLYLAVAKVPFFGGRMNGLEAFELG